MYAFCLNMKFPFICTFVLGLFFMGWTWGISSNEGKTCYNNMFAICGFSQFGVKEVDWPAQSPDFNSTFGMNWNTNSETDVITQHQFWA